MLGYFPVLNAATFLFPNFKELFNDATACITDLTFDLNHFKPSCTKNSFCFLFQKRGAKINLLISHFQNFKETFF